MNTFTSILALLSSVALGSDSQYIYYTTDDGTNAGTPAVLDAAENQGVPITFFVNSNALEQAKWGHWHVDTNLAYFERIVAEGHTLADHSYNHMAHNSELTYPNPDQAYRSLDDIRYFGQMNTNPLWKQMKHGGKRTVAFQTMLRSMAQMVRMPYTNNWRVSMANGHPDIHHNCVTCTTPVSSGLLGVQIADALHAQGVQVYGWDLEWRSGWGTGLLDSSDYILDQVKSMTTSGRQRIGQANKVVILNHDHGFINNEHAQRELEKFFRDAKAAGFVFRTMATYHKD